MAGVVCFVVGIMLTLMSFFMLSLLQMQKFAMYYSMGSIISVAGTGFVVCAKKQVRPPRLPPCPAPARARSTASSTRQGALTNRKRGGAGAVFIQILTLWCALLVSHASPPCSGTTC